MGRKAPISSETWHCSHIPALPRDQRQLVSCPAAGPYIQARQHLEVAIPAKRPQTNIPVRHSSLQTTSPSIGLHLTIRQSSTLLVRSARLSARVFL